MDDICTIRYKCYILLNLSFSGPSASLNRVLVGACNGWHGDSANPAIGLCFISTSEELSESAAIEKTSEYQYTKRSNKI